MNQKIQNFSILTVLLGRVSNGTTKEDGKPYAVASASLAMGVGKPAMPVKVVLLGELAHAGPVKEGNTLTFLGKLLYDQKKDGHGALVLRPYQIQEHVDPARNFVKLTLRAGTEPEPRYSDGGTYWARLRAALGQGKDPDGNWKPSAWFTIKGFTHEGDESVPQALSALKKGSLFTVSGRLGYDQSQDGLKEYYSLYAVKVESLAAEETETGSPTEQPEEQEPIF
jgi:hypothetical protein